MRSTTADVRETAPAPIPQCPPWCASTHDGPFSVREEQVYRERAHLHVVGIVPKHPDDVEFSSIASVEVVRRDSLVTGQPGTAEIYASTDGHLNPGQAEQFAAYIREAAAFVRQVTTLGAPNEVPADFARQMRMRGH